MKRYVFPASATPPSCLPCNGTGFVGTHLTLQHQGHEERVFFQCRPCVGTGLQVVRTKTYCGAPGCGRPQFETPFGVCCADGHGGAPPLASADEADPT